MDEEDLVCMYCSNEFSTKFSLKRHIRTIHEGQKTFICECRKSFGTSDQLRRHQLSKHSEERPFRCSFKNCGRTFGSKNALVYHEKNTHNLTQFKCPIPSCGQFLDKFNDLKAHLKLPHTNNPEDRYEDTSKALRKEINELHLMKKKFVKKGRPKKRQVEEEEDEAEQRWINLISEL